MCKTKKLKENLSFIGVICVILSTAMVTLKNIHSNLTEESHKQQLGSIAVGVSSHRKDGCLLLSGQGENWQTFKMPHFSAHAQLETQKRNKLSLASVWLSRQLLIMKTCMVLHKEND